jgi:hypothetical protein
MTLLERLRERALKTKTDLDQDRAHKRRERERSERERHNATAAEYKRDNAYCPTCQLDCSTMLRKHGTDLLAYYLGTCPERHTVRREITLRDRYYDVSPLVRRDRLVHADDMLTPRDYRFRHVYPDKWRALEEERERRETVGN